MGPAQRAVGGVARSVGGAFDDTGAQAEQLARENAELRAQLRTSDDLRRRVDELDALLRLKDAGGYTVVPARVSALGSTLGFAWTVTIDVGSDDGVQPGQTVVNGDGLVGRTTRVGRTTSVVLLLVDPGFSVGSRLTREGTIGIARGGATGPLTYQQVDGGRGEIGDALVTTGSETFVPGVPVGRVTAVDNGRGTLVPTASVEPFADITSLDLVGVVVEPPRGEPRVPIPPVEQPPS